MARDHELFVGWDHPRRNATIRRAYARPSVFVGRRVERELQPRSAAANAGAYGSGPFTDAAGEYQGVNTAERRRERTELAPDSIDEQFDCELRVRLTARE